MRKKLLESENEILQFLVKLLKKLKHEQYSSLKVPFEKVVLKLSMFSSVSLWQSVIFVDRQTNGQWPFRFCPTARIFFLRLLGFLGACVWKHLWESASRTIFQLQGLGAKTLRSPGNSFSTECQFTPQNLFPEIYCLIVYGL